MKYCKPNLQARQQLQELRFCIEQIRDTLYEVAELDTPIRAQPAFYECMVALLEASQHCGDLRRFASPLFLTDLERDLKKAVNE